MFANIKNWWQLKIKAFTLIELLAIIVILAIIAVITVPIILNVIENSKRGAATNSAYGYKDAVSKWYISELQNDSSLILNGVYIISDGKLGNEEINISGNKPSSGYLNYANNKLLNGCLVFGDYSVTFEDGKVKNTEKGTCSSSEEEALLAFKGDSWATFIENIKSNDLTKTSKYEVGDTAKIKMTIDNEEKEYTLRIANKPRVSTDSDYASYNSVCSNPSNSQTACGWVIEFADIVTTHRMNTWITGGANGEGNKGGWEYSDMRAYLNNGVYLNDDTNGNRIDYSETGLLNFIPEPIKSAIIDTRVVSGYGNDEISNFITTDKLYLLSWREVWNYTGSYDTAQGNTRQVDYYKIKGVTGSSYASAIKKDLNNTASNWWLRTATCEYSNFFVGVDTNGSKTQYTFSCACGVSPAFRLAN